MKKLSCYKYTFLAVLLPVDHCMSYKAAFSYLRPTDRFSLQTEATQHVRRQRPWTMWYDDVEKTQHNTVAANWRLNDGSGFSLPVVDAHQADMLPLVPTGMLLQSVQLQLRHCGPG